MCGIICLIKYGGTLSTEITKTAHLKIAPRGPDAQNHIQINSDPNIYLGFSRLAIMDVSNDGLQPFTRGTNHVICNGEIYNFAELAKEHGIEMRTKCDCEVILPLYEKLGFVEMIKSLKSEFAMIVFDEENQILYAGRDKFGVRPLFFGQNKSTRTYGFASEMKALHDIMEDIEPVKPNVFFKFDLKTETIERIPYYDYQSLNMPPVIYSEDFIKERIRELFTNAVRTRLFTDRPIGFLLSGGLDSSLILAIACRILGPENVTCFSVGMEQSPDVIAAKRVVEYLGIKNHHIIPFDVETGIKMIPEVIKVIESYDITTIRASTCQLKMTKYIRENTDIKVLLSGEGSDEVIGGYRYFRDAPNAEQFHLETIRLLEELYMFDNLRTDKTISNQGLEVRVPYLDYSYVEFIMSIDPELLMYKSGQMEKQFLRDSFVGYLPDEILYRSKEAFSDAVSSTEVNWFKSVQKFASETITEEDVTNNPFEFNKPQTIDALFFREIFNSHYPGRDNVISHYWLPRFQKEIVNDPSAIVLKCY